MLLKRLRETAECTDGDGRAIMRADLYEGANRAWELDLRQLDGSGVISKRYESEEAARRDLELAYRFGREHGTWRVQRAADYEPVDGAPTPAR